jgi:hypothetical protein
MNCNTDEQNTANSTVENNSSLICQSKSDQLEQLTGLRNRGVGNQLAVFFAVFIETYSKIHIYVLLSLKIMNFA